MSKSLNLLDVFTMPEPTINPILPTLQTLKSYFVEIPNKQQIENKRYLIACKYFKSGGCEKGSKCGFTHDTNDSKTRYKTQICVNFSNNSCKYRNQCSFAHGKHQLRNQ